MVAYGFRQLVVWQTGMELCVEVHRLAKRLPASERFELASQMRSAAASITANIAEGNGRDHLAEYLRFLSIARGSLMELDNHLELAQRLGYVSQTEARKAADLLAQVRRLLFRLAHSLRSRRNLKPET